MPAPICEEVRWLIVIAVEDDGSVAEVAKTFRVSVKSVNRYHMMFKETEKVAPKATGGDRRSKNIEVYHNEIMAIVEKKPDKTLDEIAKDLATKKGKEAKFGVSSFWRFFDRHDYSRKKKTGHAAEQSNPNIEQQRGTFITQYNESHRVVFIDESGIQPNLTRSHGLCKRGKRLEMAIPHGHRKNLTCVAAISDSEMISRWIFQGPINTKKFIQWLKQDMLKKINPEDTLIMDNLSVHKTKAVRDTIEEKGVKLLFLPPYSPDFNPIEKSFSKLKALLRKAEKRTINSLKRAVKKIIDSISADECAAYFRYCIRQMNKVRKEYLENQNLDN